MFLFLPRSSAAACSRVMACMLLLCGVGVILEQGRHEELLAIPNGGYARLVAAQMKGGK